MIIYDWISKGMIDWDGGERPTYKGILRITYHQGDITDFNVIERPLAKQLDLSGASDLNEVFFLFNLFRFFNRFFRSNYRFFNVGHGEFSLVDKYNGSMLRVELIRGALVLSCRIRTLHEVRSKKHPAVRMGASKPYP
jgi:hypothetical protein